MTDHTPAAPWLWAGASGYSFKEWKGPFYPPDLAADGMLAYYARHLGTVEINNTFYRMPSRETVAGWVQGTPERFRFAVKASRRITHDGRLHADKVADSVAYLYGQLAGMGAKLAAVLFQLPPNLKQDLPRLREFVALLPAGHRAAFEFRHDSWLDDATYAVLREAGAALVLSEREDALPPPLVETAPWGYLRLRLEQYADADHAAWAERLAASGWREVYAYYMHEPTAPGYAQALMHQAASRPRAGG
jgi:uncharacterized protein YecE (DUF72 family)